MLAKRFRLRKSDIDLLFRHGHTPMKTPIVIRIRSTEQPLSRFCILFGKNVKAENVEKNRIRRQLYAQVRKRLGHLKTHKDYGMIVTPKLLSLPRKTRMKWVEKTLDIIEKNLNY